jgi:hypothetical protein
MRAGNDFERCARMIAGHIGDLADYAREAEVGEAVVWTKPSTA